MCACTYTPFLCARTQISLPVLNVFGSMTAELVLLESALPAGVPPDSQKHKLLRFTDLPAQGKSHSVCLFLTDHSFVE